MPKSQPAHRHIATASQVTAHMHTLADAVQAEQMMKFFKTAPGEYGHGDCFLGIKVPETRRIAAMAGTLPLSEVELLLASPFHEVRLCGLLVLVKQFEAQCLRGKLDDLSAREMRDQIADFYLAHAECANNWDLVDLTVYKIVGRWLLLPSRYSDSEKLAIVDGLAASSCLWRQRMSIVCTMEPLRHGDASFTLRYAHRHLHHPHDLMQKAVGWLLREMGKRVSIDILRDFLRSEAHTMPRTTLRYAIERMPADERQLWLRAKQSVEGSS